MAGGDYNQYMILQGMDSIEFFEMYDLHKKKIEEMLKNNPPNGK